MNAGRHFYVNSKNNSFLLWFGIFSMLSCLNLFFFCDGLIWRMPDFWPPEASFPATEYSTSPTCAWTLRTFGTSVTIFTFEVNLSAISMMEANVSKNFGLWRIPGEIVTICVIITKVLANARWRDLKGILNTQTWVFCCSM